MPLSEEFEALVERREQLLEDTLEAFRHWQGQDEIKSFYSDNAPELKSSARAANWTMPTSAPGKPQSNGLAEKIVRTVKTGTKTGNEREKR